MSNREEKKFIEKVVLTAKELWGEDAVKIREHIEKTAGAMYRIREFELTSGIEPIIKMGHDE
jgi:hypothetical protein